jgi:hypothetical protein
MNQQEKLPDGSIRMSSGRQIESGEFETYFKTQLNLMA